MPRNKLSPLDIKVREDISNNLKRLAHGRTQQRISNETGIPVSTLSGYFAKRSTPNAGAVQKLADYFGVNKSDIDPRYGTSPQNLKPVNETIKIPLLGTIACGDPILADENIAGYLSEPTDFLPSGKLFYLRAKGQSMEPTIKDGSLVLIRQQPDVEDGEIAAILFMDDNEATLKRIKRAGPTVILMPDNREYEPIIASNSNPVRILGKAVRVTTNL
ncbi:LexA family protein [Limosilactobacillus fermentum]|uniref:LexA family protein n=1 Tax=Limosilactobacillus fermentum TaxID=1613 RepID=UPI0022E39AA4|nr:XRE family transcriptional regulator [Limosilactobacillus fermentum]